MIVLEGICKTFRVSRRKEGFQEAFKTLFRREYEEIRALQDVSFTVQKGEMVGYIGPNGRGKAAPSKS